MEEFDFDIFGEYDDYPESVNLGVEDLWWIRGQEQAAPEAQADRD